MRILIISHGHPDYSIGGAEVASHTLFRALNTLPGHDAFYLSRAPSMIRRHAATPLMALRRGANETFLHTDAWDEFWLSNGNLPELAGAFAEYLKRINPQVVHFHHIIGFGVEAVALVRRVLPQARIVITFHEYLAICANHGQMVKAGRRQLCHEASPADCSSCFPHRSPAEFFSREEHIRRHFLLADAYVSPSAFLRRRYEDWGLPSDRFHVIENAVGEGSQPTATQTRPRKQNRFAYFGQISEFKGLQIVLEAIERIPDDVWEDAVLNIFGGNLEFQPIAFRERFESLLKAAGRRARFFDSYRQDELPTLMHDTDWVVMPSIWWENSPVVIQEAFLHRRPLIVSNIGGMAEKVRDGIDGIHFRVGSPESLAEKMSLALTDGSLWSRLSRAAPSPLDPATFARQHISTYEMAERAAETSGKYAPATTCAAF